jgi:hypothetical protein
VGFTGWKRRGEGLRINDGSQVRTTERHPQYPLRLGNVAGTGERMPLRTYLCMQLTSRSSAQDLEAMSVAADSMEFFELFIVMMQYPRC